MKDFFKDNQKNIILVAGVVVVSAILFWMALDYKNQTAEARVDKNKLLRDTQEINQTDYKLNSDNKGKAEDNLNLIRNRFNDRYKLLMQKYNYKEGDLIKALTTERAQSEFAKKIEGMDRVLKNSGVEVAAGFDYSFSNVQDTILKMKPKERDVIFEQLNCVENLMKVCAQSKILSVVSIVRKYDTEKTSSKFKFARTYSISLTVTCTPKGMHDLIDKISNDPSYYYHLTNMDLKTASQVDGDLMPITARKEPVSSEEPGEPKGRGLELGPGGDEEMDRLLDGVGPAGRTPELMEKKEEKKVDELIVHPTNIKAFLLPNQTLRLDFDWVQFNEKFLVKESK